MNDKMPTREQIDRDELILTIRDVSADHHGNGRLSLSGPEAARIADAVLALFSQPTPSAGPCPDCGEHALNQKGNCVSCDYRVPEPVSTADMAQGTTFTARFFDQDYDRFLVVVNDSDWPVMDPAEADQYRWSAVDSSTIRDVTPPKETA